MTHHEAAPPEVPAQSTTTRAPAWDVPPTERLSERHSPGRPGTVLVSSDQMLDHLVGLVGPESAGPAAVWISFVTPDDRILPVAIPVEDLPSLPDESTMEGLSALVRRVVAENFPGACALVAVVRAGGGDYGAHERRWAGALWRAADTGGWTVRTMAAVGDGRARVLARDRCL
ncbi:hypothetical protein [Sanguibacter sp. 25GB23B1]|uniref:hypothetical protein n=1 Tax=unclassified Sanguibacter TaxID=2645534 RepID=UPI0032AF055D